MKRVTEPLTKYSDKVNKSMTIQSVLPLFNNLRLAVICVAPIFTIGIFTQTAHAGLLGTNLSVKVISQATFSSPAEELSFEDSSIVTEPGIEFPSLAALDIQQPGYHVVDVAINAGDEFIEIDFDNTGRYSRFSSAYFNGYEFTFNSDVAENIIGVSIDALANSLGIATSDLSFSGNKLRVNVESLNFTTSTFARINLVVSKHPPKNQGKADPDCPKTCDGNPINASTGNKFQVETDYVGVPHTGLGIRRFYNSQNSTGSAFGAGWRGTWLQSINIEPGSNTIQVTRDDGRVENFVKNADGNWQTDPDVINQLIALTDENNQQTGWKLLTSDDASEIYSLDGRLVSVTTRAGQTTTLSYDSNNRLNSVTGHFGHSLIFDYDLNNRISSITLPDGGIYRYSYDAKNNLALVIYPNYTVRKYLYENTTFTHALTGIIDENGKRFASWTYDAQGRATSSQHAGGAELTTVAYNSDGSATVTDALGNKHGYNFTTQFDVVKPIEVTGAANKGLGAKSFTYDANGFVASQTDFNGNVTTFVRDAKGQETSRTEAFGTALARTISTTWHTRFRLPTKISEPNRVTSFSYDANGNLIKRTVTAGNDSRSWTFAYNDVGQVLTVDGPRTDVSDISQYAYDDTGNLSSITDALGHVTQFIAYNANGQPTSIKDANGLIKTLSYDARGRVTSIKVGDEITSYAYDAVGQVSKTIAPDGSTIVFSYDDAHRLVKVTDPLGNYVKYTLDAMGNKIKEEIYDPKSNLAQALSRQFDSLNRLVVKLDSAGQKTKYAYDDNDNPQSVLDPLGNATTLSYDALNRLVKSVDPAGNSLTTAYDANDNLLSVTDPLAHATQYDYDGMGNALTIDSPDTGIASSQYDSAGNKIETTDARGEKVSYSYDALNRIKQIQYGNSQIISFTYDQGTNGIGHLTQMNDAAGVTRWNYDGHGRINSKTFTSGSLTLITRYAYDAKGRLATMTYPSGKVVQVTYQNGLVSGLDSNGKSLISGVGYRPFGAPAEWLFGNGVKTSREYDLDGRLVAYDLGDRTRQLNYDAAGRITGYQDTDMKYDQSFSYDALSRLVSDTRPSSQIRYDYDANGNRTGKATDGISDLAKIDAGSNRLLNSSNPAKSYSYDAAGNIVNNGNHQFTYDGRGRLIKASSTLDTEYYLINGLGQRLAKLKSTPVDMAGDADQDGALTASDLRLIVLMAKGTVAVNLAGDCNHDGKITSADAVCTQSKMADMRVNPGKYQPVGTYFVYDEAGHLTGEYTEKGAPIQETVWLGDTPVAVTTGGNNYYVYADHLNAPKAITDDAGRTVWRWDSEAFGNTQANEDPDKDGNAFVYNLRFPGQYYDKLTGLHYNGFRDYDPKIGRYIESDPIGLNGGLNTYSYTFNNPINATDFSGLESAKTNEFNQTKDPLLWSFVENYKTPDGVYVIGRHSAPGSWRQVDYAYYKYRASELRAKTVVTMACNTAIRGGNSLSNAEQLSKEIPDSFILATEDFFWSSGVIAPTNQPGVNWSNYTAEAGKTGPNLKDQKGYAIFRNGQREYFPLSLITH